jgi:hypothetical protein
MTLEPNSPTATPRTRNVGGIITASIAGALLLFVGWIIFVQYRIQSQGLAL